MDFSYLLGSTNPRPIAVEGERAKDFVSDVSLLGPMSQSQFPFLRQ